MAAFYQFYLKEVKKGVCSLKENKLADVDNFRPELLK